VLARTRDIPLVISVILLSSTAIIAQTKSGVAPIEITGQVRYAAGGAPADKVLVTCEQYSGGGMIGQILTDRTGKFQFRNIPPAVYTITVRAPGYRDVKETADLQTMTRTYLQLQLVADNPGPSPNSTKTVESGIPAEAQKEFEKGKTELLEEKKIESGVAHLEKAVAAYPKYLEAHLLLSNAYVESNNFEKAAKEAQSAIALDPKQPAGHFTLGEVYRRQQKYPQAEQTIQEGLKLDPKSSQGHFALAQVYYAQGDLAKAGPQIGTALQLKPDFAEAHLLAGNILLKARKPEGALQMFQEYLRLAPNGASAPQAREVVEKIKKALAEKK
jgi:cytochrome c-type biogenesis protein CcmH/NrfG